MRGRRHRRKRQPRLACITGRRPAPRRGGGLVDIGDGEHIASIRPLRPSSKVTSVLTKQLGEPS
jgi:hypothetical protein